MRYDSMYAKLFQNQYYHEKLNSNKCSIEKYDMIACVKNYFKIYTGMQSQTEVTASQQTQNICITFAQQHCTNVIQMFCVCWVS